jgi:hypothetical protein
VGVAYFKVTLESDRRWSDQVRGPDVFGYAAAKRFCHDRAMKRVKVDLGGCLVSPLPEAMPCANWNSCTRATVIRTIEISLIDPAEL